MRIYCLFLSALVFSASAQTKIDLTSLSDFRDQAGNWSIVGSVSIDPNLDIHEKVEVDKKKKKGSDVQTPKAVMFTEGSGILLNYNDDKKKDHLLTTWEHGDIELELEVMIPKGSNSGIYLQGRYEVQLLDSWGVRNPSFSDIGGIYRNWESEPGKILKGIPPLTNAAKAPGTWQKMKILFQAPRFDSQGSKTENARFVYVELNGIRIHDNIEVELPTGGPIENNEVESGPLMIQGDHGPVAFRNISYRVIGACTAEVEDISYEVFRGDFRTTSDIEGLTPTKSGKIDQIDVNLTQAEDRYAIRFKGKLTIAEADLYQLKIGYTGGATLVLDGKELISNQSTDDWRYNDAQVELAPGTYDFVLTNFKNAGWRPLRLGFYIQGSSTDIKTFNTYDSYPETGDLRSPIFVDSKEVTLHRGFVYFRDGQPKLSHTIAVGDPSGVHYIYDLNSGTMVASWRGEFIDATPMWDGRGDGSFRTRGATLWTFLGQSTALLATSGAMFPETGETGLFVPKGYKIDESTGTPVFQHTYRGIPIETKIEVDPAGKFLNQTIKIGESNSGELVHKLAEGTEIRQMPNGYYAINDQEYFINVSNGSNAEIRTVGDKQELILKANQNTISYSIIW